jgi:hypothetical protein
MQSRFDTIVIESNGFYFYVRHYLSICLSVDMNTGNNGEQSSIAKSITGNGCHSTDV